MYNFLCYCFEIIQHNYFILKRSKHLFFSIKKRPCSLQKLFQKRRHLPLNVAGNHWIWRWKSWILALEQVIEFFSLIYKVESVYLSSYLVLRIRTTYVSKSPWSTVKSPRYGGKTILMKWGNTWAPKRPQDMSEGLGLTISLAIMSLVTPADFQDSKGREKSFLKFRMTHRRKNFSRKSFSNSWGRFSWNSLSVLLTGNSAYYKSKISISPTLPVVAIDFIYNVILGIVLVICG